MGGRAWDLLWKNNFWGRPETVMRKRLVTVLPWCTTADKNAEKFQFSVEFLSKRFFFENFSNFHRKNRQRGPQANFFTKKFFFKFFFLQNCLFQATSALTLSQAFLELIGPSVSLQSIKNVSPNAPEHRIPQNSPQNAFKPIEIPIPNPSAQCKSKRTQKKSHFSVSRKFFLCRRDGGKGVWKIFLYFIKT